MQGTKHKNPLIVSVSSHGREDYNKAMLNLIDSKKQHCDNYDMLLFSVDGNKAKHKGQNIKLGSWPITKKFGICEPHKLNPYQFKTYAIWKAYEMGYTQIIWCDSTIKIQKNPDELWPLVKEQGITTWDNFAYPLEEWVTDQSLKWCGYESAKGLKQIMACCMMFDFNNPITLPIVEAWVKSSQEGCFKSKTSTNKNFKESRHDQSMMSLLLNKSNIPINDYGVLSYPNYVPTEPTFMNCGLD